MALMVRYDEPGVTQDSYEAARREINWENEPAPGGLLHMAFFDEGGIHTIDIWESRAQLEAYLNDRFEPALKRLGISSAKPDIIDLHAVVVSPNIEEYFLRPPASA